MTIFDPVPLKGPPYHLRESPPEELALHRARLDKFEELKRLQQTIDERAAEKAAMEKQTSDRGE